MDCGNNFFQCQALVTAPQIGVFWPGLFAGSELFADSGLLGYLYESLLTLLFESLLFKTLLPARAFPSLRAPAAQKEESTADCVQREHAGLGAQDEKVTKELKERF